MDGCGILAEETMLGVLMGAWGAVLLEIRSGVWEEEGAAGEVRAGRKDDVFRLQVWSLRICGMYTAGAPGES